MNGPRLAYVCSDPGIPPDGTKGASIHFREFGRALVRSGFDVQACTSRAPGSRFDHFPLRVHGRASSLGGDRISRELLDLTDQGAMVRGLGRLEPHDAVYERYSLFGLAGLTHAQRRGLPFFLEVNAPLWEEALAYRDLALAGTARALARDLFMRATRVLVVSKGLALRLEGLGVPRERIVLFANGVSPSFLQAEPAARRPAPLANRPIMTFVGSLKPWHGIEFLLEGFERLSQRTDVGLWIVGHGPLAEAVDRVCARYPDRVVRTPVVPHAVVPSILRASDIAVAPYTTDSPHYFCPLKVVEALATGTPVLASDVPATRDLDLDGAVFQWFRAGNLDAFVAAACATLRDLDARKQQAAERNPDVVRRRFTWDRRAVELARLVRAHRHSVAGAA